MANSQRFVIRTLTSQNRRIYEQAQGRKQQYEAISQKIAEEEATRIPTIVNHHSVIYIVHNSASTYSYTDIYATNTKGIRDYATGSSSNWSITNNVQAIDAVGTNKTVTFTYTDPHNGQVVRTTRRVIIVEHPTITLTGSSSVTIVQGQSYTEPSPAYKLNHSAPFPGNETVSKVDNPSNFVSVVGTAKITYTVTYSGITVYGLNAISVTRDVTVNAPQSVSLSDPYPVIYTQVVSALSSGGPEEPTEVFEYNDTMDHVNYESTAASNYTDNYYENYNVEAEIEAQEALAQAEHQSYLQIVSPDVITGDGLSSSSTIYNKPVSVVNSKGDTEKSDSGSANWTITGNVSTVFATTQTVNYQYKDPYIGTTVSKTRTVYVIPKPTLTLNGNASENLVVGNVWVDPSVNLTNRVSDDSYEVSNAVPVDGSNKLTTTGVYNVTYKLRFPGKVGNAVTELSATRRVEVNVAQTPDDVPILDIRPTTMYHVYGKNYQEFGVICYQKVRGVRGNLTPTMSQTITNTTAVGTYNVTYSATNAKGTTTVNRIIIVVQQPTITRVEAASIHRYVGEPLDDPGYTIDTKGVSVNPDVVITNAPPTDIYRNLTTANTYNMTYTMSYKIGGIKFPTFTDQTFTRTVVVKAPKPTISLNPTKVYWPKGVAYNDGVVGGITTTNAGGGITTNPSNPASISTTTVGSSHNIVYTVNNGSGETVTATRIVQIIQQPTLSLNTPTTMNLKPGDVWNDPGYVALDAFGQTSREVSITGVPALDLENRLTTAGTYTVTYTLRISNTPSTQVTSVVTATRTVNVVAPTNPPVLTVSPKRIYHRHRDTYTDSGVSAKDHAGNDITGSITTTITKDGSTIANASLIKDVIGEYIFAYEVTHNSITVKDTRRVDVYSDLLDTRNFIDPDTHTRATTTTANHPSATDFKVNTYPGASKNEKIVIDNTKATCDVLKPFTFMTWIRIPTGVTKGAVTLLKTKQLRIWLEIKNDVADYFNGSISTPQIKAVMYGPIWGPGYWTEIKKTRYAIAYPHVLRDSKRRVWTSMHDCPRVNEWLWYSLQFDGSKHFIMSLNGTRYEHCYSYYGDTVHNTDVMVGESNNEPTNAAIKFELCNTCFIYRFLHIHEIQTLYEYFVQHNLKSRYDGFGADLNVVDGYITKFKNKTNTSSDDTNFENALRNIRIIGHCALQKGDGSHLKKALEIITKFETDQGPLFVGPVRDKFWKEKVGSLYQLRYDYYGFAPYQHANAQESAKQLHTHRLARGMLFFQHIVWDAGLQPNSPYKHYFVSSEYQISYASELQTKQLQNEAEKAQWYTATHIKGQTTNVTDTAKTMSIVLKIRNRKVDGILGDYAVAPQARCTGMWVNRGVISEVTVPESLINTGIQLCVGAHRNDPSLVEGGHGGGKHGRMDRIATHFLIDRSTVRVYNPLGGNLYVLLPYGVDIGMITLTATNVVPARLFRIINDNITGFHDTTTKSQWDAAKNVANGGPPTVDIETDHVLVHIPSHWIEENVNSHNWLTDIQGLTSIFDRIKDLALKYDSLCKNVVKFRGMSGLDQVGAIDHPMLYTSVDMVMRSSAGGVGWPMVNDPTITADRVNHYIMNWCIDSGVVWHELGHMYCNRALGFSNEGESSNEVMGIYLLHQTCGYDLDSAFRLRNYGMSSMSLDHAVIDWMKEDMFVNGNYMSYRYAGYQLRSWHKYMDIVALVGWDGFLAYQRAENLAFDRARDSTPPTPLDTSDTQRIVRMSLALGIDMAPLMEFWGITDPNLANQTTFRNNVRTIIDRDLMGKKNAYFAPYGPSHQRQDCNVHRCRGVRTLLLYFKSLIPKTNKDALEYVWNSWIRAYPDSTPESLVTGVGGGDKYLNWWENFYNVDKKKWDAAKITAIENRIDQILSLHGLTNDPSAEPNCIACANNKPDFEPPSKMHSSWANMPRLSRINAIPYSALTFYVTEDGTGFIVKGERDHMGALSAGRMPTLNIRFLTKLVFYVSTTTPFYILHNNGTSQMSKVKNQGVTDGVLIWYMDHNADSKYGNNKGGYISNIKKVFGPV